jgi:dihydrolipoamide dehydrogenase
VTNVVVIGGGPGGYEAALVARQLGAQVTLVESGGLGGSAVLTDCVPSKTLIATSGVMAEVGGAAELGLRYGPKGEQSVDTGVGVDLAAVNQRVIRLAEQQSDDIGDRLRRDGVGVVAGCGRLDGNRQVIVSTQQGERRLNADVILLATGAHPRVLPDAVPDGERILSWTQLYELAELPQRLIVVGSGVTGAEFASGYHALGVDVVLVSSRELVLPGEDPDAARVLQDVFDRRGLRVMSRSRAAGVTRDGDEVTVTLTDGRTVTGSHCLLAVGSQANVSELGLETAGIELTDRGFIDVDRVSRTSAAGVYAAGDCTGVQMLASVSAMQGRIAMSHALGDAVTPLDLASVSACVFTAPEIATVGVSQSQVDSGEVNAVSAKLDLTSNPRAKMQGIREGFAKVFCLPANGIVVGGAIVAPRASELIFPVAMAVAQRITVDQLATDFTVYPSLSGSVAETARTLHGHDQLRR